MALLLAERAAGDGGEEELDHLEHQQAAAVAASLHSGQDTAQEI